MNKQDTKWEEMYEYANIYYNHYGNLEVPARFKTNDGYTYGEDGKINLGTWIVSQRVSTLPTSERGKKLLKIGMRFENKRNILPWEEMYEYAKKYYEHHNNLEVPQKFKTDDGYTYNENGKINLGTWVYSQRTRNLPTSERGKLLLKIGMDFENSKNMLTWKKMYEYAKIYYEYYGNLEVPDRFITNDGYTHDENGKIKLGIWITTQRTRDRQGILTKERIDALEEIGMRFENKNCVLTWEEMYNYAKTYYKHHGNLHINLHFKTSNGYEMDNCGEITLGFWINTQRQNYRKGKLTQSQVILLESIGMIWSVKKNQKEISELCNNTNIDVNINKDILKHISIQELQ